jgi:hypothetical protein
MRIIYSRIITRLIDKHSMTGHPDWKWLKHRHKEMCRPINVLDNNGQGSTVYHDSTNLPDDIYNCPPDGIPFIYSFGDSNQLSTLMKKPIHSDKSAKPRTAGMLGCIAFSELLNPDNELECQSTIVFIYEVVCQNDPFEFIVEHEKWNFDRARWWKSFKSEGRLAIPLLITLLKDLWGW